MKTASVDSLHLFLEQWFNADNSLCVKTSGSTGTPKKIRILKEQMRQSARITCNFLGLKKGDSALLCLPVDYIAGKMMVVRSLYAGLNLHCVEPSGHPLASDLFDNQEFQCDFAAMIPMQVLNSLKAEKERERFFRIKNLIIGGAAIDPDLAARLIPLPGNIYSTYGMTETVSHIAMRRLNGPEASDWYTPFESVRVSLSGEGTLQIDAPLVCSQRLVTNDIAEIRPDSTFRILGRRDNVINSGGIKIQVEPLESSLIPLVGRPFVITSVPHPFLGEAVVMLVLRTDDSEIDRLKKKLQSFLPPYHRPKFILSVPNIPQTPNGKIDRKAAKFNAKVLVGVKS